jgi:hypothetical protein
MAALRVLCNAAGTPDFSKLQIGGYLDGIDLSEIAAIAANAAGQSWNGAYRNNRIVIAAFNPYKGVGDTDAACFRQCAATGENEPLEHQRGNLCRERDAGIPRRFERRRRFCVHKLGA